MQSYLVVKRVNLQVRKKVYRKDAIITARDVGQGNISRYLRRGYIKPIGGNVLTDDIGQEPITKDGITLLTPEEVNRIRRKPDLIIYAKEIGMENVNPDDTIPNIKAAINLFIEEMAEADTEDEEDEEDEEGDEDNGEETDTGDNSGENGSEGAAAAVSNNA